MAEKQPQNLTLAGKVVVFIAAEAQAAFLKTSKKFKEGQKEEKEEAFLPAAPAYIGVLPVQKMIKSEDAKLAGLDAKLLVKSYAPNFVIAEVIFEMSDILSQQIWDYKKEAVALCQKTLADYKTDKEFYEEYAVYCVSDYESDPEVFLAWVGEKIAPLLKSEKVALDDKEITETLNFNIKYAKNDLTVVDWDGAFVFNPFGRFEQHIELFELTNFELLKLRKLDAALDQHLDKVYKMLRRRPKRFMFGMREMREIIAEIIKMRTEALSDYDSIEKNVKLIGDWYSARLYDLISKKLHLPEWNKKIQSKIGTLEDIYSMLADNFSVSFESRMNLIQMAGWFVLLLGWGILLGFDIWLAIGK